MFEEVAVVQSEETFVRHPRDARRTVASVRNMVL